MIKKLCTTFVTLSLIMVFAANGMNNSDSQSNNKRNSSLFDLTLNDSSDESLDISFISPIQNANKGDLNDSLSPYAKKNLTRIDRALELGPQYFNDKVLNLAMKLNVLVKKINKKDKQIIVDANKNEKITVFNDYDPENLKMYAEKEFLTHTIESSMKKMTFDGMEKALKELPGIQVNNTNEYITKLNCHPTEEKFLKLYVKRKAEKSKKFLDSKDCKPLR